MDKNSNIKKTIEEIMDKMGISYEEITITDEEGERTSFMVKTAESGRLIGTRGENISALNHVIKRIVGKDASPDDPKHNFYVDVNDYHKKITEEIKNKITILADRARSLKVNVELDPMSSYERMIVHTHFESVSDIETESKGLGKDRRVVIKYIGE
jgi:spoIIIJ-associated protein